MPAHSTAETLAHPDRDFRPNSRCGEWIGTVRPPHARLACPGLK
jgi:hypothetical protein